MKLNYCCCNCGSPEHVFTNLGFGHSLSHPAKLIARRSSSPLRFERGT